MSSPGPGSQEHGHASRLARISAWRTRNGPLVQALASQPRRDLVVALARVAGPQAGATFTNVVNSSRSRSGEAWASCSSSRRAASILGVTVIVVSFFESVVGDHSRDHAVAVAYFRATRSPDPYTTLADSTGGPPPACPIVPNTLTTNRPQGSRTMAPACGTAPTSRTPARFPSWIPGFDSRHRLPPQGTARCPEPVTDHPAGVMRGSGGRADRRSRPAVREPEARRRASDDAGDRRQVQQRTTSRRSGADHAARHGVRWLRGAPRRDPQPHRDHPDGQREHP